MSSARSSSGIIVVTLMMQALNYKLEVTADGRLELPPVGLTPGLRVEVIILVPEAQELDSDSLVLASQSSLGFWDNPIDDEVWNDAKEVLL